MKIKRTIIGVAFILPGLITVGQTTQRFTADKTNEYALVYSLPQTVIDITIETEHTVKTPGEFNNYAIRYLGLSESDVIREPEHTVKIKSISMTPRGVANPDNRWQVQFKVGSAPTMVLMPDGVPLSINVDAEAPGEVAVPQPIEAQPTALEGPAAREAITEEMMRSTTQSRKAQAASNRIFELRQRRNDIFSGDTEAMPPDGQATQLILKGMSDQEAALTAMFTGTTQTYTEVATITFTPGKETENKFLLARISPLEGMVEKDDYSGIPIYLNYHILTRGKLPVNEKGEVKKFPKGGVAYTIPGSARISLTFNGKTIAEQDFDIAQLGDTFGVDPAMFTDKKAPAYLEFSPVTGAVVKLGTK